MRRILQQKIFSGIEGIFIKSSNKIFIIFLLMIVTVSCKKFVEVDNLKNQLLAEQVFEDDITANAAINGIYRTLRSTTLGGTALLCNTMISDEIVPYLNSNTGAYVTNTLLPTDALLSWDMYYKVIYQANNAIEKLQASKGVSETARKYYIGEAKFVRAFCYFYLVNLYGDAPLILTIDVQTNNTMPRTSVGQVYGQIVADLKDAQAVLGNTYSYTGGDRSRANKWVATALLARTYLYQKDWTNAEAHANAVIGDTQYSLLNGPTGIFVKNNNEAIWQWANNASEANSLASSFIYTTSPASVCTSFLLNAFEVGDLRKTIWIKTQTYQSQPVNFPFKFTSTAVGSTECYTAIRLAEMYLIRAEAKAMRNDFQGCIDDVNLVRLRHGNLSVPLPAPANQTTALDVVLHERQVDLFTEGMHRWFDLKRTGRIDAIMLAEKPTTWKSYAALYPIPLVDIQRNSNLKQNQGYE